MPSLRRNIDILLIVLVGFVLRLAISVSHSYTNDELSAINRLRYDTWGDLLENGVKTGDMHPAGVQVFEKLWSSVFGTSELALRFPFVLFGTLSIWMIFLLGRNWFNRETGIFAAVLLSGLYFPMEQSELARPYAPGLLLSLIVAWYFYKVLIAKVPSYRHAVFLGITFALSGYTHYFLLLFVLFVGFTGLFLLRKTNFKHYLISMLLGILLFLPHLPITLHHLRVGGLGWLGPPELTFLPEFLFFVLNDSWILTLILLILLGAAMFVRNPDFSFKTRPYVLCGVWFFGIYLIGHILSLISTPILKAPVMLFALPFFFLMIGFNLSRFQQAVKISFVLFAAVIMSSWVERDLFGIRHQGFKDTARHLVTWNKQFGSENIYTVYNLSNPDYLNFYATRYGDSIHFDRDLIEFSDDVLIREELKSRKEPYCVVGYSERLTLPNVLETVREFYPSIAERYQYDNSAVFLMSKYEENGPKIQEELFSAMDLFEAQNDHWLLRPELIQSDSEDVHRTYVLEGENIYGPDYIFKKSDANKLEHYYLRVEVKAILPEDGQLTVSMSGLRDGEIIRHRGENFWLGHDLEQMLIDTRDANGIGTAYFAFSIPDFIRESDELKISLWNRNGKKNQIVSFEIYLVENCWN